MADPIYGKLTIDLVGCTNFSAMPLVMQPDNSALAIAGFLRQLCVDLNADIWAGKIDKSMLREAPTPNQFAYSRSPFCDVRIVMDSSKNREIGEERMTVRLTKAIFMILAASRNDPFNPWPDITPLYMPLDTVGYWLKGWIPAHTSMLTLFEASPLRRITIQDVTYTCEMMSSPFSDVAQVGTELGIYFNNKGHGLSGTVTFYRAGTEDIFYVHSFTVGGGSTYTSIYHELGGYLAPIEYDIEVMLDSTLATEGRQYSDLRYGYADPLTFHVDN